MTGVCCQVHSARSRTAATKSKRGFTFDLETLTAAGIKKAGFDSFSLGLQKAQKITRSLFEALSL